MLEDDIDLIGQRPLRGGDGEGYQQYQHGKSFFYSGLTALSFGIGNHFLANASKNLGYKAIYPQCIGGTFMWLLYHGFHAVNHWVYHDHFFTKENSSYFKERGNNSFFANY